MDGFYNNQLSLDMDGNKQRQQQSIQSGDMYDGGMVKMDENPYGGNFFDQDVQSPTLSSRRHSHPHTQQPFSPNSAVHNRVSMSSADFRGLGADGGMSMLDYTNAATPVGSSGDMHSAVADAFKNFSFGGADGAMNFSLSTNGMPQTSMEQQRSAMTSQAVSSFSPATGMLSVSPEANAFPSFSQSMMGGMMSYPVLNMSQINGNNSSSLVDASPLDYFSTDGPDSGNTQASAMSFTTAQQDALMALAFGPSMDMDMSNGLPLLPDERDRSLEMGMPPSLQQQRQAGQSQINLPPTRSTSSHNPPSSTTPLFRPKISLQPQQRQQQSPYSSALPASTSMSSTPQPSAQVSSTPASTSTALTPTQLSSGGAASTALTSLNSGPAVSGPSPPAPTPISTKTIKNYYSSSGFDMIRALYYVASRPNPEISIGPVDLSCAFVVCDATLTDCPIIYISDNFQHLTGYSNHEILGQNCRFLQSPDGRVESGTRRDFTDNKAVMNIKEKLYSGREVQQSLINYRKGGKPFLNLLTMIPIPWDDYKGGYKYFIGLQIDLVESPEAISGISGDSMSIDYKHRTSIPQYIWDPPKNAQWNTNHGRTLGMDDVSALLQQFGNNGLKGSKAVGSDIVSSATFDLYRQSWDKMLLENADDVIHVLSLKGVFLYLSPSCKEVLEYDASDLLGNSLSSICHPSDIVPVTREMRDTQVDQPVNFVYRIRRKRSGYTWFESHGSLLVEQGKGRKCIVLVGRKRPALALRRCDVDINGGIGDSEIWTKLSTSGMILHVTSNVRSLLDIQPDALVGTSIQDLMRKESRAGFNRSLEKVRRGIIASCRHEVQHRRGQVLQSSTILYPGDAERGEKPTFVLGQTRLVKSPSSRNNNQHSITTGTSSNSGIACGEIDEIGRAGATGQLAEADHQSNGVLSSAGGGKLALGTQDALLAADDNIFDELKTTRCTSWQFELRQMEKANRLLAEELGQLLANRKKRKRRKGVGNVPRDCANCHTRNTPEWRRGPSGQRDLCNSCGLRWAKQVGRVSPRNSSRGGNSTRIATGTSGAMTSADALSKKSASPIHASPLHRDFPADVVASHSNSRNDFYTSMRSPATGKGNGEGNGDATGIDNGDDDESNVAASALFETQIPPSTGTEMSSIHEDRETVF
ncbi:blue light receptor [Sporothrix epigloea]|uniref:Blue light receptor n=1 Tax=Sporothrix epigloea TaxID=1892477 RepID=A0ABP0DHD6_9PEZI